MKMLLKPLVLYHFENHGAKSIVFIVVLKTGDHGLRSRDAFCFGEVAKPMFFDTCCAGAGSTNPGKPSTNL